MNDNNIVFIAPAAGRKVNCKHFLGYTPGGEGGGVNYDAFPDFYRHPQFQNAECVPLVPGKSAWETGWKLATAHELGMRSQMHRIVRVLEEYPLSQQEYERLIDLTAIGSSIRKKLDERLERLGLIEGCDSYSEELEVECTYLFYSQAYGQYNNLPYDGQLKLPYIDAHGNFCNVTQYTAAEKVYQILRPQLVKEWLQNLNPETIVGRTNKCMGCPLATYIQSTLRMNVEVGNVFDLSTFSYEGVMYDLPDWAWGFASAIDEGTIQLLDLDDPSGIDNETMYPDYPSVPVKAKHALEIFELCSGFGFEFERVYITD